MEENEIRLPEGPKQVIHSVYGIDTKEKFYFHYEGFSEEDAIRRSMAWITDSGLTKERIAMLYMSHVLVQRIDGELKSVGETYDRMDLTDEGLMLTPMDQNEYGYMYSAPGNRRFLRMFLRSEKFYQKCLQENIPRLVETKGSCRFTIEIVDRPTL